VPGSSSPGALRFSWTSLGMYDYDRRKMSAARVTLGRFGRVDADGGAPADILLDGVSVGEVVRVVDSTFKGVTQRTFTVKSYVPSFQGPILGKASVEAVDDKEYPDLQELKRAIAHALDGIPEGVSEVYRLYKERKITQAEWQTKVKALL
jgi:hypothetical protein